MSLLKIRRLNKIRPSEIDEEQNGVLVVIGGPLIPGAEEQQAPRAGIIDLYEIADVGDLTLGLVQGQGRQ